MTTGATDINTDPGFSRAMWPVMDPASVPSVKSPWYWVAACATQTCIAPREHGPWVPTWSKVADQIRGKHMALSCNRSHRHLLNPHCRWPVDACYPNQYGSRCYKALGGKQASHISLLLITFTSFILPFPIEHNRIDSLSLPFICHIFAPHNGTHMFEVLGPRLVCGWLAPAWMEMHQAGCGYLFTSPGSSHRFFLYLLSFYATHILF